MYRVTARAQIRGVKTAPRLAAAAHDEEGSRDTLDVRPCRTLQSWGARGRVHRGQPRGAPGPRDESQAWRDRDACAGSSDPPRTPSLRIQNNMTGAALKDSLRGSSVKLRTMQRRLAWPLRKDDPHKSRSVYTNNLLQEQL